MNERTPSHITDLEWSRFWQNQMTDEEQNALLAHTSSCSYCSSRIAEELPAEQVLTAPAYLKEETIHYIRKRERFRSPFRNKSFRLFTYSLKVSLAAACVLAILFTIPSGDFTYGDLTGDTTFPSSGKEASETEAPENNRFESGWLDKQFGSRRSFGGFLNDGTSFINNKLNEFSTQLINKEDIFNEKQK